MSDRLKVVDLFCGAGGFSEGFRQAGFDIVLAIDFDEDALQTHMINHPETDHLLAEIGHPDYKDDIVEIIKSYNPDVIIGSPPCQNFSIANTKKDESIGMELMNEFLRIVEKINPKYWVGENVRGVKKYLDRKLVPGKLLNSANYGVPQKRYRYFFGSYPVPNITHPKKEWLTIEDIYIKELNTIDYTELPDNAVKRLNNYNYQKHSGFPHSKAIAIDKPMKTLTAHHDNAQMLLVQNANGGAKGKNVKPTNGQSYTLTTSNSQLVYNPHKATFRKFCIRELKLIMGFPYHYRFLGAKTTKIRQIGNSVTPPVAKAIGEAVLRGVAVLSKQKSLEAFF